MKHLAIFSMLLMALVGCNKKDLGVEITVIKSSVKQPGNVSVFFQMKDENGVPMDKLEENYDQHFKLLDDGEEKSKFEAKWVVKPDSKAFSNYTLLVLDISGSVRQNSMETLKESSKEFVKSILKANPTHLISIALFAGDEKMLRLYGGDFSSDLALWESEIDDIGPGGNWILDDTTNLNGAVIEAAGILRQHRLANSTVAFSNYNLVLFTDGTDQANRQTRAQAESAVDNVKSFMPTLNILTVGLAGESDAEVLNSFGMDGYYEASKMSDLKMKFQEVVTKIGQIANSYYFFNYCSPRRSGTHKLELKFAKKIGEINYSGSTIQNYSATNFSGGCTLESFNTEFMPPAPVPVVPNPVPVEPTPTPVMPTPVPEPTPVQKLSWTRTFDSNLKTTETIYNAFISNFSMTLSARYDDSAKYTVSIPELKIGSNYKITIRLAYPLTFDGGLEVKLGGNQITSVFGTVANHEIIREAQGQSFELSFFSSRADSQYITATVSSIKIEEL